MSEAIISAANQAAWAGRSLVDSRVTEFGEVIVLNNSSGAPVSVAGISDAQRPFDIRRVINRGTDAIVLAAEDVAALAKDRLATEVELDAAAATLLFYNGTRWEPYTEA